MTRSYHKHFLVIGDSMISEELCLHLHEPELWIGVADRYCYAWLFSVFVHDNLYVRVTILLRLYHLVE